MSKLSSDELLLMATANLKKGIEYAVNQIRSKRVDPDTKLRWIRSLTRQVEALVKVAEASNNIESKSANDIDLATYLSSLEKKIAKATSQQPISSDAAKECRRTIRRAISHISELRHATSRQH